MKLKVVIVDDEKKIREVLKKLLSLLANDYEVVGEAPSIKVAKKVIRTMEPDIVLLDIRLEDGTGFDLVNDLEKIDFKLIFITAYDQYAIKAFKFNALDYLLKPIDPTEFKEALEKAQKNIYADNEIKDIVATFKESQAFEAQKIVIRTTSETHFIAINDIQYCHSQGAYTSIVTKETTILASKNLKHFQDLLEEHQFMRTHQSYLVNKKWVSTIKNDTLILTNAIAIPISSRKKAEIKAVLSNIL